MVLWGLVRELLPSPPFLIICLILLPFCSLFFLFPLASSSSSSPPLHLSPRLGTIASHLLHCVWVWGSASPCSCPLWSSLYQGVAPVLSLPTDSGTCLVCVTECTTHLTLAMCLLVLFQWGSPPKPSSGSRSELWPIAFSLFPRLGLFLLYSNLSKLY